LRPVTRFLNDGLIERIISEARDILCNLGVEIHNEKVVSMLGDHGAGVDDDKVRVFYTQNIIERALETVPSSIMLYDSSGNEAVDLSGYNVNFTPGSSAISILDYESAEARLPSTPDYVRYCRLISGLDHIASQSTAMIPADVHEVISDSYRLYLSLMLCTKPVVTGMFTAESFGVMRDLQLAVRGSEKELAEKPLCIFSCCPANPVRWSEVSAQNLVDCAQYSIPVECISMPLMGFTAPVTMVGSLVQHTAENLSGLVISQLAGPGTPVLYGGSPAVFDIRYETTPLGAVCSMMTACAYNEIGKYLGMPTQAYIGLSDAKLLDSQAGMESSMGAALASLEGINSISGPGMIDFQSCFSLEKLVMDNELCGMIQRLIKGIEPKDDFPAMPLFTELLREKHLLISDHTMKHINDEFYLPGPVIDRANRERWKEEGASGLNERAHAQVDRITGEYKNSVLPESIRDDLNRLIKDEASLRGAGKLPETGI